MKVRRSKLRAMRQWLSPGMRIKRWLLLLGAGAVLVGAALIYLMEAASHSGWLAAPLRDLLALTFLPTFWRVLLPLLVGAGLMGLALTRLGKNLVRPFRRPGDSVA